MPNDLTRMEAKGRFGDNRLAHLSDEEIDILNWAQGGESINPDTGLPEFFKLKKILKTVAKAGAALAGAYFGGPAGAAVGGGLASKLLGDSTSTALTTGLLSGLGAWGAQSTGLGDAVGGGLASGADLLGRTAEAGAGTVQTASAAGAGGGGMSSILPMLGIGAAAAGAGMAGSGKGAKLPKEAPDNSRVPAYEKLDREARLNAGDPYTYGQFGPEFMNFEDVNPDLQRLARGGRVHFRYGGESAHDTSEGRGDPTGSNRGGGNGGRQEGRGGGGRDVVGGRATTGASISGSNKGHVVDTLRGAGSFATPTGTMSGIPNKHIQEGISAFDKYKNRSSLWDALDMIAGPLVNTVQPQWDKIGTYAGGDWHTGTSIPGTAGMIGGALAGVPIVGGLAGQWIGDKIGIPDVLHGGYDSVPDWAKSEQTGEIHGPQGGTGNGSALMQVALPQPSVTSAAGAAGTPRIPGTKTGDDVRTGADRNRTGRPYNPLVDPYTYGQFGPEHEFFGADLDMAGGGPARGPGDGQSDDIPAMLSDGEHVLDAETVSMLGDGSNDAGHLRLEEMKRKIRAKKRSAAPSQIPPPTGSITQYLRRAA